MNTETTLTELARMWEATDPAPPGLAERCIVTIGMDDLDAEYELLHLVERTHALAGTRGTTGDCLTVVFSSGDASLMLRLSPLDDDAHRVDGWVSPPRAVRISLQQTESRHDATSDARGRFQIDRVPHGMYRAVLSATHPERNGSAHIDGQIFATPAFEI